MRAKDYYGPWSQADLDLLAELWPGNIPTTEIANRLGRSGSALGRMARKMHLAHRPRISSRIVHTVHCQQCGTSESREYITYASGKTWARIGNYCRDCEATRKRTKYVKRGKEVFWNDERKETVIRLWKEGKSRSEVAAYFGVTPNAAMGIVFRLGLCGNRRPYVQPQVAHQRKLQKQRERYARFRINILSSKPPKLRREKAGASARSGSQVDAPPPLNLSLIENNGCMWPTERGFCGHPKAGHKHRPHYCEAHCRA